MFNATSPKRKYKRCEWPEASFAIGSPFLTSKNGGVNTDDSPHPSQKISQISDYNNQLGGFNPVEYVSQQTTMFSLLENQTYTTKNWLIARCTKNSLPIANWGNFHCHLSLPESIFSEKNFGMTGNPENLLVNSAKNRLPDLKPTFTASQIGGSRCRGATGTRQAFPRFVRWGKGHHQMKRIAIILKPLRPFFRWNPTKGKRSKTVMNQKKSHFFHKPDVFSSWVFNVMCSFNKRGCGESCCSPHLENCWWLLQLQVVKVIP